MIRMTFRTEMEGDDVRVPPLLLALGVQLLTHNVISPEEFPDFTMGAFTVEVPEGVSLEDFRSLMEVTIDSDKRFVDMHRCFQTLNLGLEPDEEWFKK